MAHAECELPGSSAPSRRNSMTDTDLRQPDPGPLRAAAEAAELAQAASWLVRIDGCLADSDPLAPLARDIARSMTETGLTIHHCAQYHPLHRLGGVCLLAVRAESGTGSSGIAVSPVDRTRGGSFGRSGRNGRPSGYRLGRDLRCGCAAGPAGAGSPGGRGGRSDRGCVHAVPSGRCGRGGGRAGKRVPGRAAGSWPFRGDAEVVLQGPAAVVPVLRLSGRRRTTGQPPGPPGYGPPALRTRGPAARPGATRATLISGRL
jgi:hypothetical protein